MPSATCSVEGCPLERYLSFVSEFDLSTEIAVALTGAGIGHISLGNPPSACRDREVQGPALAAAVLQANTGATLLTLVGLTVCGPLVLDGVRLDLAMEFKDCTFDSHVSLRSSRLPNIRFSNVTMLSLDMDS